MKVALVSCPIWAYMNPPLSLAVIQAYLKEHGNTVSVFDFGSNFYNKKKKSHWILSLFSYFFIMKYLKFYYKLNLFQKKQFGVYTKKILDSGADVVCFSTYRVNALISLYIASKLKEANPSIRVVFGGPGVYFKPIRNFIRKFGVVDKIISSDGQSSLRELFQYLDIDVDLLPKDINDEPIPDFSGFELNGYQSKILPYSTTRGCYSQCSFCFDIVYWKKFQQKKPEKLVRDLQVLKQKYGVRRVLFSDSVMLGTPQNLEAFCDQVTDHGLDILWEGQVRAQGLDKRLLNKMHKAGCRYIALGIESGSQRILNLMNKDASIVRMEAAVQYAKQLGMVVVGMFIVGYPTETWKDFFDTVRFIRRNRNNLNWVRPNVLSILDGTKLEADAENYSIKNKNNFYWSVRWNNIFTRYLRFGIIQLLCRHWKISLPLRERLYN